MLTLIAGALVETLVKHMFQKKLNEMDKIEIGGAPSWYMKEIDDEMCTFAHTMGNLDTIDTTKFKARIKMTRDINNLLKIVIYDNTKKITNQKEKQIVKLWANDPNLDMFTYKYLNYSRVAYEDEIQTTFVRACIPKSIIIDYQKERLQSIKKSLLTFKTNNAMNELDNMLEKEQLNLEKKK